jgi:hypothetical protein
MENSRLSPVSFQTAVVGGPDAEAVVAGGKVVIEGLPASAGVRPIAIVAFQLVAKLDLLRRHKAESGVVDLQIVAQRGQVQIRSCRARQVLPAGFAIGEPDLSGIWQVDKNSANTSRILPRISSSASFPSSHGRRPLPGNGQPAHTPASIRPPTACPQAFRYSTGLTRFIRSKSFRSRTWW